MVKKINSPMVVTPSMKVVIDRWNEFITVNNIRFSPWTDTIFKAKVVAEVMHCPCDYQRLSCPCELCLGEIALTGTCYCRVFCSQKYIDEHSTPLRSPGSAAEASQ